MDKSVIGRFGYLLVLKYPMLLAKNTDLLLAASKPDASQELMLTIKEAAEK